MELPINKNKVIILKNIEKLLYQLAVAATQNEEHAIAVVKCCLYDLWKEEHFYTCNDKQRQSRLIWLVTVHSKQVTY